MRRSAFLSGTAGLALGGLPVGLRAQIPTDTRIDVRVGFFPGASAWPLWSGVDNGVFAGGNLRVTLFPTPSSEVLFTKLDASELDIAHTSIDNPIGYDIGTGAAAVTARDFAAFFGVDDGLLRLIAKPGIAKISDLRGKAIAVDAPTTGYTFALRAMLESAGIGTADVTTVVSGGTAQRYAKLMSGDFDATLLTPPYDLQANARGFRTLGRAGDIVGPYQGIAGVARRSWLTTHHEIALRYLRAYRAALNGLIADQTMACTLFVKHNPDVTPDLALQTYRVAFGGREGFHRDAAIDIEGVRTVLRLRARYLPPGGGTEPAPYIDTTLHAMSAPERL